MTFGNPGTRIISIAPRPYAEIEELCDEVLRYPLEAVDLTTFEELDAGDIFFFDGSHRVFTDFEVTCTSARVGRVGLEPTTRRL